MCVCACVCVFQLAEQSIRIGDSPVSGSLCVYVYVCVCPRRYAVNDGSAKDMDMQRKRSVIGPHAVQLVGGPPELTSFECRGLSCLARVHVLLVLVSVQGSRAVSTDTVTVP